MNQRRQYVFNQIDEERSRQDYLHGDFNDTLSALSPEFIVMITEELGEAAQVLQDLRKYKTNPVMFDDCLKAYDSELTQVAALAVQVKERLAQTFSQLRTEEA